MPECGVKLGASHKSFLHLWGKWHRLLKMIAAFPDMAFVGTAQSAVAHFGGSDVRARDCATTRH